MKKNENIVQKSIQSFTCENHFKVRSIFKISNTECTLRSLCANESPSTIRTPFTPQIIVFSSIGMRIALFSHNRLCDHVLLPSYLKETGIRDSPTNAEVAAFTS